MQVVVDGKAEQLLIWSCAEGRYSISGKGLVMGGYILEIEMKDSVAIEKNNVL